LISPIARPLLYSTTMSTTDLTTRTYIRWDDPKVEQIPPNEETDIQEAADIVNKLQTMVYDKTRHCYSGKLQMFPPTQ
jgi:hypothetical protein